MRYLLALLLIPFIRNKLHNLNLSASPFYPHLFSFIFKDMNFEKIRVKWGAYRLIFCNLFLINGIILFLPLEAKVRVLTFHYNAPELIELQYKTCRKYIKDDFELIVFNDAPNEELAQQIKDEAKKFGVKCVRYQQEWHQTEPFNDLWLKWMNNKETYYSYSHIHETLSPQTHPSIRHTHVIQYALDNYGYNHNDIVVLMDGDCFPNRPLSFKKLLGKNHVAGIEKIQEGTDYLWVVMTFFDPRRLPHKEDFNFSIDIIDRFIHDTGSHTHHYLRNHSDVRCQTFKGGSCSEFYPFSDKELLQRGFKEKEIAFMRELSSLEGFPWPITVEFHINNRFVHFGNSSFGLPGYREKLRVFKNYLKKSDVLE